MLQFKGKKSTFALITALFVSGIAVFFHSCSSGQTMDESRIWCMKQSDSMWMQLNAVRKQFTYNTAEIAQRKYDMDSVLRILKFTADPKFSGSEVSMVSQYNSIFRVYRDFSPRYSAAVLKAEECFFQLKAIDKRIKAGKYDKNTALFKKETAEIKSAMNEMTAEVAEVTGRISAVEPAYRRVSEKVEQLTADLLSKSR